jgi:hypothetical protein
MKKKPSSSRRRKRAEPPMRADYDFRAGARGKYAGGYAAGTNLVLLAPDVADHFKTAASVNRALRKYLRLTPRKK